MNNSTYSGTKYLRRWFPCYADVPEQAQFQPCRDGLSLRKRCQNAKDAWKGLHTACNPWRDRDGRVFDRRSTVWWWRGSLLALEWVVLPWRVILVFGEQSRPSSIPSWHNSDVFWCCRHAGLYHNLLGQELPSPGSPPMWLDLFSLQSSPKRLVLPARKWKSARVWVDSLALLLRRLCWLFLRKEADFLRECANDEGCIIWLSSSPTRNPVTSHVMRGFVFNNIRRSDWKSLYWQKIFSRHFYSLAQKGCLFPTSRPDGMIK